MNFVIASSDACDAHNIQRNTNCCKTLPVFHEVGGMRMQMPNESRKLINLLFSSRESIVNFVKNREATFMIYVRLPLLQFLLMKQFTYKQCGLSPISP